MKIIQLFVERLPEALEAASKSPLGVLALLAMFLFAIVYAVWREAPMPLKYFLGCGIILSAATFLFQISTALTDLTASDPATPQRQIRTNVDGAPDPQVLPRSTSLHPSPKDADRQLRRIELPDDVREQVEREARKAASQREEQ